MTLPHVFRIVPAAAIGRTAHAARFASLATSSTTTTSLSPNRPGCRVRRAYLPLPPLPVSAAASTARPGKDLDESGCVDRRRLSPSLVADPPPGTTTAARPFLPDRPPTRSHRPPPSRGGRRRVASSPSPAASTTPATVATEGFPVRVPGRTAVGNPARARLLSTSSPSRSLPSRAIPSDLLSLPHDSPEIQDLIAKHARHTQTSASLQTLMKSGRGEFLHKMEKGASESASSSDVGDSSEATERVLLQVAGFCRHEMPIRLAHRIQDLERVPLLADVPSVRAVKELYTTSFLELISKDKAITAHRQEEEFAEILEGIYERHSRVLVQMARGAFELRAAIRDGAPLPGDKGGSGNRQKDEFELMESTHAFLDRFYISRIGIRVLIGQYLSLRQPPVENYVGIICGRTSPYEIVKRAIDDAAFMCARKYGDAPEVIITGRMNMTFPYVPTHLHYIMLELLKNSMRATVEYHGVDADYPPIKVVIADGNDNEDVIIKVSDEGGGIPRSNMKRIWSYLFTTADPEIQEGMVGLNENVDHSIDSPLAGLGYGLPISRSYARYFGGDLSIMSMEGYGTDAFVYLTRLGNTREPLPI